MLKRGRRLFISIFVSLAVPSVGSAAFQVANLDTAAKTAIKKFAQRLELDVTADSIGSISATAVKGNDIVWSQAFGWADRDLRIPATPETIYRVGSISKSITAMLMMRLVELGKLELDDPVARYFPAIRHIESPIEGIPDVTFRQLASHTAGLIREPRLRDAAAGPISMWEDKILLSIPTTAYQSVPGTQYAYSNIGYGILGLAISRAAERPFMDLVHELIFSPLKMNSSSFILTASQREKMSVGYVKSDRGVSSERPTHELVGRGYKVPNGGVYSTANDLARLIASQTGSSPVAALSERSLEQIHQVQTPESARPRYGLGFIILQTDGGYQAIGHTGSVAGHRAALFYHLESNIGVVLLRNYNRGRTNLRRSALQLLDQLVSVN